MRRGLISWSKKEMPEAVLKGRVQELQRSMVENNLDACLAYTSIAQPSAVNWLTHFTPYWSEALLVVLPEGSPILLASLTKRVHTWINEVSLMGEIRMAPKLGENTTSLLNEKLQKKAKVGVIGMNSLPGSVSSFLFNEKNGIEFVDFSETFSKIKLRSDLSEVGLVKRAEKIAKIAFDKLTNLYHSASTLASELELKARLEGAEEVIIRIAPDLSKNSIFCRLETELSLASTFSVELSLAYKGVWIRSVKNFADESALNEYKSAEKWWSEAVRDFKFSNDSMPKSLKVEHHVHTTFEACMGVYPLEALDFKQINKDQKISWGVLSAEIQFGQFIWPASQAVYCS
jgi:hypothetical protein